MLSLPAVVDTRLEGQVLPSGSSSPTDDTDFFLFLYLLKMYTCRHISYLKNKMDKNSLQLTLGFNFEDLKQRTGYKKAFSLGLNLLFCNLKYNVQNYYFSLTALFQKRR